MERKNLFIPFYLEYAGCCKFGENDSRIIFRRADDNGVLVKIISDKSISISEMPTPDHYELKRMGEIESKKLVDRLRNIIWKDVTDVSIVVDSESYNPIEYGDKNVYLATIFNCISTDFYTNEVSGVSGIYEYWEKMKNLDGDRLEEGDRYYSILYLIMDRSLGTGTHRRIISESKDAEFVLKKTYHHIIKESEKGLEGVNLSKLNGVRDTKSGISFIRMFIPSPEDSGEYLVGIKFSDDEGYSLVLIELEDESDIDSERYVPLQDSEKSFVYRILDENTRIYSVDRTWTNGNGSRTRFEIKGASSMFGDYLLGIRKWIVKYSDVGLPKNSELFLKPVGNVAEYLLSKINEVNWKNFLGDGIVIRRNILSILDRIDNLKEKNKK
jgi:hypothetical protein